jgi:hypothetical protein
MDPYPAHTEALCKAIGVGLLRWQYVETALYLVALCFMETDHQTGSRIFFYIKSADTKLALADRLVSLKLEQQTRKKFWEPIVKDIKEAINSRNWLAHFERFQLDEKDMKKLETSYRVAASYHHLDEHARRNDLVRVLTVEHIEHNAEETRFLTYKIIYFLLDHAPQLDMLLARLPPDTLQWLDSFRKTDRPPEFQPPRKSSHK